MSSGEREEVAEVRHQREEKNFKILGGRTYPTSGGGEWGRKTGCAREKTLASFASTGSEGERNDWGKKKPATIREKKRKSSFYIEGYVMIGVPGEIRGVRGTIRNASG